MKWFLISLYAKVQANGAINGQSDINAQETPGMNDVPDIPKEDIPTSIEPLPATADFSVADIIIAIIRFILSFAAALAVLMIIYGGIRYIVSGGNQEAVEAAKKVIIYAVFGIIIITLSFVIVNFVQNIPPVIVP